MTGQKVKLINKTAKTFLALLLGLGFQAVFSITAAKRAGP
jgi:hypothetical protein